MAHRGQGISRGLTRAAITAAALKVVDERGLSGLSMRAIAAELDVEAMSLYNHVRDKDDLLDSLISHVDAEATAAPGDGPWWERLSAMASAFRATMHRHPEVARLFAIRPTAGPAWAGGVERTLRAFTDAGLDASAAAYAYRIFWAYVTGYVIREIRQTPAPTLGDQLDQLDKREYPLTRGLPAHLRNADDQEFQLGLDAVIHGIITRVAGPPRFP